MIGPARQTRAYVPRAIDIGWQTFTAATAPSPGYHEANRRASNGEWVPSARENRACAYLKEETWQLNDAARELVPIGACGSFAKQTKAARR